MGGSLKGIGMHSLTVSLGSVAWRLLFKTEEKAAAAYAQVFTPDAFGPCLALEDDYGQRLSVARASIHGCMLEDLDKAKIANVELQLYNAHVQNMANKAIQADRGLQASRVMHSPSIHQPGGLNG